MPRLVFFFISFLFFTQFFARKIFLEYLGGDDFMGGLTSTLQSFLSFLNLAELGIGTAIGFTLYQPIFDKNHQEINHIIRFFGNIYKKIGWAIIGLAWYFQLSSLLFLRIRVFHYSLFIMLFLPF